MTSLWSWTGLSQCQAICFRLAVTLLALLFQCFFCWTHVWGFGVGGIKAQVIDHAKLAMNVFTGINGVVVYKAPNVVGAVWHGTIDEEHRVDGRIIDIESGKFAMVFPILSKSVIGRSHADYKVVGPGVRSDRVGRISHKASDPYIQSRGLTKVFIAEVGEAPSLRSIMRPGHYGAFFEIIDYAKMRIYISHGASLRGSYGGFAGIMRSIGDILSSLQREGRLRRGSIASDRGISSCKFVLPLGLPFSPLGHDRRSIRSLSRLLGGKCLFLDFTECIVHYSLLLPRDIGVDASSYESKPCPNSKNHLYAYVLPVSKSLIGVIFSALILAYILAYRETLKCFFYGLIGLVLCGFLIACGSDYILDILPN